MNPDVVIHCAALASIDQCEESPELARTLNTELPARIAALTCAMGARLVHISTDAVFDGKEGGYAEEDEAVPANVMGKRNLRPSTRS